MRAATQRGGAHLLAATKPLVPVRTGRTAAALVFRMDRTGAEVRGRLTVLGGRTQQQIMLWLDRGTRPHWITPLRAQVLRFVVSGTVFFRGRAFHPGTKPLHIFTRGFHAALPLIRREYALANRRVTLILGRGA